VEQSKGPGSLITTEFLALNAILFISYCNVAVFFEFHRYLSTLPIAAGWYGFLIALFSLVVLAVRPFISPFLTPLNSRRWLAISCMGLIPAMFLYGSAQDVWSMSLVRIIHGLAYVVMATALASILVACIPKDRSAQAFGLASVMTLLPYAVLPPLLEPLDKWAGGFPNVLELSSILFVLVFPMLLFIKKPVTDAAAESVWKFNKSDLWENLSDRSILLVLFLSLTIWTTFAPVFFFLKDYGTGIGIANPGWFFTLSIFTEIAVRLFAGSFFDKMDKRKLLAFSMAWLGLGYLAIIYFRGDVLFNALGLFMGLGWGVALPVLSGLVFDISAPRFKALNTNLSMVLFQGGFFLGPLAGGAILVQWGYAALYFACALVQAVSVVAALMIGRTEE
jgi:MFS family permease